MRKPSVYLSLLLMAHSASAVITSYPPTRDTYMRGSPTDLHGTSPSGRASKAYLDFYISDFDRAAISGAIEGQLGHPLSFADMDNVEISWNLFSNDFEGYKPTAFSRPAVFQGTENWVEGTDSTLGATKGFAVYDPIIPANTRTWKNRAGADVSGFLNLDRVENAVFEEWGGMLDTYREWVLDDAVAFAYLTDPLSLGLFLNASDAGNPNDIDAQYNNTEVYSREIAAVEQQPFLKVTVVPEPGVGGAMVAAALVVSGRRRRSRAAGPAALARFQKKTALD